MKTNDIDSLNHTSWNCKYHIVFAPKYRRKVAYGKMKAEIGKILRELCSWKQVEIVGRSRGLSRSYSHAGKDTAEDKCIGICRISQREKHITDI